uniref:Odorant receptor 85b n=1 Tax=Drosophila melanogaster TaxID=7227 RepID=OR85B_DROME|nr:odorant receptor 85b [Drosophila melanogaster]Q9VHQ7.2 RecName: Full=Odorant receptor 85b [Drosophila melanogaster]AAF54244.2 odorant receptor 85b [Drosophila melanogaster]|eukprot:NP_524279.2 odorant receptor 85b [Drosophila melanogaster]
MEKLMKYASFFYTAVGIRPYTNGEESKMNKLIFHIVFWSNVINLSFVGLFESIYVYSAFMDNKFLEAVTALSYIGFVTVGMSKMFFIRWKKTAITELINELKEIYPNGLIREERYNLPMYLGTCSRISLIYSLLYSVLIWTFNLFCVMEYWVYDKWLNIRVVGKQLPYLMYIPWKWQDNWSYYPLLFSQNFAGYTSAAGQISTDVLLCAVATQLVMHFDFLSNSMERHELSGDWKKDSRFLVDIVRYHERILRLSDAVNDIFGIPLLLNFMVSSFVICFVGFQMTVGVPPDIVVKLFLFLVSSMSQVYLICHYGQLVADASYGFSVATYNQKWYKADVRYKRALVIIIARSQKVTFLKATIFLDITRSTMTDLLQISYKFFALLRTMYTQ